MLNACTLSIYLKHILVAINSWVSINISFFSSKNGLQGAAVHRDSIKHNFDRSKVLGTSHDKISSSRFVTVQNFFSFVILKVAINVELQPRRLCIMTKYLIYDVQNVSDEASDSIVSTFLIYLSNHALCLHIVRG